MPAGDDAVAVVVRLGAPLTTAKVSPLTKPVMVAVNVGRGAPATLLALFAVTVNTDLLTVIAVLVSEKFALAGLAWSGVVALAATV